MNNGNGPRTCPNCGIFYYEWLQQDWKAMLTSGAEASEPLIPNVHECPEPYPREIAESLCQFYASSGMPIHPREKARIKLGLDGPGLPRLSGGTR